MTIPAPKFLKDDPWFGPAVLSERSKKLFAKTLVPDKKIAIHQKMYEMSTKVDLTRVKDQPWVSGAGR